MHKLWLRQLSVLGFQECVECVLDQDMVEGRRLIAFTLRYLDEKQLWGGKALVAAGVLSLLEKVCEHIFATLVRMHLVHLLGLLMCQLADLFTCSAHGPQYVPSKRFDSSSGCMRACVLIATRKENILYACTQWKCLMGCTHSRPLQPSLFTMQGRARGPDIQCSAVG